MRQKNLKKRLLALAGPKEVANISEKRRACTSASLFEVTAAVPAMPPRRRPAGGISVARPTPLTRKTSVWTFRCSASVSQNVCFLLQAEEYVFYAGGRTRLSQPQTRPVWFIGFAGLCDDNGQLQTEARSDSKQKGSLGCCFRALAPRPYFCASSRIMKIETNCNASNIASARDCRLLRFVSGYPRRSSPRLREHRRRKAALLRSSCPNAGR
jgi:hypothetical protein